MTNEASEQAKKGREAKQAETAKAETPKEAKPDNTEVYRTVAEAETAAKSEKPKRSRKREPVVVA